MREKLEIHQWGYYKPEGMVLKGLNLLNHKVKLKPVKKILTRIIKKSAPVFDVKYMGACFRVYVRDNATERDIAFNKKPKIELMTVLDCLELGDCFVDIGANCGVFTVLGAIKVGADGRVLAIEPNTIMSDRLKYNVRANELANVEICEYAVGPKAGDAEFYIDRRQFGRSSIVPSKELERVRVKLDTLASLTEKKNINKIDVMKIDIEGYEYQALHPFFEAAPVSKWPRKILIETKHADKSEANSVELLIGKGYRILWSSTHDALLGLE